MERFRYQGWEMSTLTSTNSVNVMSVSTVSSRVNGFGVPPPPPSPGLSTGEMPGSGISWVSAALCAVADSKAGRFVQLPARVTAAEASTTPKPYSGL